MNDYMFEVMLKEKRSDMLKEAERLRMVRQYEKGLQGRRDAFERIIAEWLIRTGERIKHRCEIRKELAENF